MFQGNKPFGQTPFGQPATTGFSPPVFGSTSNTGLFSGSTTQQSGGLFGTGTTPAFGQPQTTTPAFGGFTATSSGSGLFGQQQNVQSGGIFGSNTTSAFGQPKPAFSSFGTQQTTGLFGQQQQQNPVQQTSLFGQPSTQSASGLFGGTPGFGATQTAPEGTTIKFVPVTGTDTMLKNGVSQNISTRHHCITCMKEYENKSLEELRLEDYAANRKGPQQGVQPGLFGATNQPSLFSASPNTGAQPTGLFGAAENKNLFGGTNQGAFGGMGTSNVFGAGSSGSTLFGKPAGAVTAFATPASTTSMGFGFNTNTNTNPFGAQKPAFGATTQAGGFFGSTAQPTNAFGTQPSGFGASFQNQQAQNGGLFGQNKPAFPIATTNAFSFNQPASSGATTSIFGAKPATTGFGGFGTTSTPNTGFTANAFGGNNQNTSAFGANFKAPGTSFNFGSTPTTNTLGTGLSLGGGSSLFGSNKPGGLFSQPNNSLFSGGFGSTNTNFNTGSNTLGTLGTSQPFNLGGGLGSQNNNMANQSNNLNNSLNLISYGSSPFGDSPVFKSLLPTGKGDKLIKPTSPATQKALITGQNFKVSPKSNNSNNMNGKIKTKSSESNIMKSLFDGLEDDENGNEISSEVRPSPRRLILKPKLTDVSITQRSLPNTPNMINELSPNINPPKAAVSPAPFASTSDGSILKKNLLPTTPVSSLVTKKVIPTLQLSSQKKTPTEVPSPENKDVHSNTSSSDSEMEDTIPPEIDHSIADHPTGIVLRRLGYYTIPSLDELAELMDSEGRCVVETFTIGRLNYGNIFYPDSFNVAGLNLDEIVHFRHKEVVVYPDDEKKPPVGTALNRRAQITLDRVWPEDKTSRAPISDPERISILDYESKLRRACAKHGTKFLDYRPQTGSWVFKVEHFSKYGLEDSDEEDVVPAATKAPQQQLQKQDAPPVLQFQKQLPPMSSTAMMIDEDDDDDMYDGIDTPYDLDENMLKGSSARKSGMWDSKFEKALSPTERLGQELGSSAKKVQLMKASFFDRGDIEVDGEFLGLSDIDQPVNFRVNGFSFDAKKLSEAYKSFNVPLTDEKDKDDLSEMSPEEPMEEIQEKISEPEDQIIYCDDQICPKTYILDRKNIVVPYASSMGYKHPKCIIDMDIFRGRSFRPGWGPGSKLTVLNTENGNSRELYSVIEGRNENDFSPFVLERHSLFSMNVQSPRIHFEKTVVEHLQIVYSQSIINDGDLNPFVTTKQGTYSLREHYNASRSLVDQINEKSENLSDKYLKLSSQVWGLCLALWDDIDSPEDSHECLMQRKEAFSNWLEEVVSDDSENSIYGLMTQHKIAEACGQALKEGNYHLSLLLSQCRSTPEIQDMSERQLIQWRETEADACINEEKLKCYMLVAGMPLFRASERVVNSCESLTWLQSLGIHLWYMNSKIASITDALIAYECAFENENFYAPKPKPFYSNDFIVERNEKDVFDVLYHLIKLFSIKSHPLELVLNPATSTPEPLDYRLSWFLMRTLMELGYSHLSKYSMAVITSSFASQLEAEGLWQWSAFVLMHIPNPDERERALKDLIGKYVSVDDKNEKELFLIEKLKIPCEWIYEAKGILAASLKRYHDAGKYFLKSQNWERAHEIILKHIFPKAIILGNHDYLEKLMNELAFGHSKKEIPNWNSCGAVVLKYFKLVRKLKGMKQSEMGEIDVMNLQIDLQDVLACLKQFATDDPLEKLSVEEMAKTTLNLAFEVSSSFVGVPVEDVQNFSDFLLQLPLSKEIMDSKWLTVIDFWNRV